jgi:hypothetical protein
MNLKIFFSLMLGLCLSWTSVQAQDLSLHFKAGASISSQEAELSGIFKQTSLFAPYVRFDDFELNQDEEGQLYIQAKAQDAKGQKAAVRKPVQRQELKDGAFSLRFMGGFAAGESCSGNNCEHCAFAPKGGCFYQRNDDSKQPNMVCNHSISR